MIWLILFIAIVIIVSLFTSPSFSPIPYFPTAHADVPELFKLIKLKKNQILIDMGAGTGTVVFRAARRAHEDGLDTKFVAVEVNFVLFLFMWFRRLVHPNKENILLIWKDMFRIDYEKVIDHFKLKDPELVYYIYISPWFTHTVYKIVTQIGREARVISYFYPVDAIKADKIVKAKNNIYEYRVPVKAGK